MPNLMNCEHLADGCCLDCVRKLIEAEREACAKVVLKMADAYGGYPDRANCQEIADAIRMRSNV